MSDELELRRSELADVETALAEAAEGADVRGLEERRGQLEEAIVTLQRAARQEAGVVEVVDVPAGARPSDFLTPPTGLVVPSLVPGSPEHVQETLLVLDRHDEDAVLGALEDRFDPVLVYSFSKDGKTLTDLSWQGVMEAVRLINGTGHARIGVVPGMLQIEEPVEDVGKGPERFYSVIVQSIEHGTGFTAYGHAMEPANMRLRNGNTKFDVFAKTKALNKAQRNALKMQIPERIRQAVIAMALRNSGRVLEIKHGTGAAAAAQLPPPVDTPEAEALTKECRDLYVEIKALPRGLEKLLPGQFHFELSRARSSVATLEAFRDSLVSRRDALKEAADA